MKTLATWFVAAVVASSLVAPSAQERPVPAASVGRHLIVPGGVSPDKRFEIRVVETPDFTPSNYVVAIVDASSGRIVKRLEPSGGYYTYASVKVRTEIGPGPLVNAAWHPSGRFFALTDFGLAGANTLNVYEVTGSDVIAIPLPAYQQNALGRVGATSTNDLAITDLRNWDKDLLSAIFTFRVSSGDHLAQYSVPFSLRLRHGASTSSHVLFETMATPSRQQLTIRTREQLAKSDSWSNLYVQHVSPGRQGVPQRVETVLTRIATYSSLTGSFNLAVVPVSATGFTYLIDDRRHSVEGSETFYIDQGDDLLICAVSSFTHLQPSFAKVRTQPGGLPAAIAHFARTVSDRQLSEAISRARTVNLRDAYPSASSLFLQSPGSAHGANPTILARNVVDSTLLLDLQSPSGGMYGSFWIVLKEGKLLKHQAGKR